MKKAFSMIELIFVIVVLGIITTIAAPKLFSNKKDADLLVLKNELASIKMNIDMMYQDTALSGQARYPTLNELQSYLNNYSKTDKWVTTGTPIKYKLTNSKILNFTYDASKGLLTCSSPSKECKEVEE